MSWGFGGIAANNTQGGGPTATTGSDLEAIETEQLGFQALAGERKLRLFPSPWPPDALPSKTSSLLTVASGRKLLAAAGPDALGIYDTDAIRSAFLEDGKVNVREASAKATTSTPRLSHIAFTSDENALVITAEQGGGLAIYDVGAAQPGWSPAFQIATQNTAIRHLLPNPNPEASHLVAVVLEDGKLLIADLKSKEFISASSGNNILRDSVSCASWSKKGKQIVAGLADGTAVQLDTQGNVKDTLPRPPAAPASLPVTEIYWLENLEFLVIHSPPPDQSNDGDTMSTMPEVFYHLVLRDKSTKVCSFHRFLDDPCPPFLDNRLPAHHYIQRLRDWPPSLDDSLIVACTASTDVGVLTRSKAALSQNLPAEQITHTYTTTSFADTRRAALPLAANGLDDTFPIGVALDLSSSQTVKKPMPNDETLYESAIPLPELCILNQEGVLSAWWYVYNEAVRAAQPAPGMDSTVSTKQSSSSNKPAFATSPVSQATTSPSKSEVGQTTTTTTPMPQAQIKPAFGQTSKPQFGSPSAPSFGTPSTPAFGTSSSLSTNTSPWAAKSDQTASTPKTTFGAPSQLGISAGGSTFGQTAGMSFGKPSVWGSSTTTKSTAHGGSTFGQPSTPFGGAKATDSPFAAFAKQHRENTAKFTASPFAGFAQSNVGASPFASFNSQSSSASPFAAQSKPDMPNETSFGSTITLSSNNGSFGSGSTFAATKSAKPSDVTNTTSDSSSGQSTGLGSLGSFKLGSTFKSDGTANDDLPQSQSAEQNLFGSGFGTALPTGGKVQGVSDSDKPALDQSPSRPIIKEEPQEVSLNDIPEAAPLPPDFTKTTPKPAEDAPLPPDFLSKPKTESNPPADDVPLPSDFPPSKQASRTTIDSHASPAHDKPSSSVSKAKDDPLLDAGPPEQDEAHDWEGVSEEDAEEDDVVQAGDDVDDDDDDDVNDEGNDESGAEEEWEEDEEDEDEDGDGDHTPQIVNHERLSAFTSRISPASPKTTAPGKQSTTPETIQKPSFTPTGFPKASVAFPPPQPVHESPRSPSPVRAVTSPLRLPRQHSSTVEPQNASTSAGRSSVFQSRPALPPVETLEDEEDAHVKQILSAPIEPSLSLPEFIAHQDYSGDSAKEGIAGQLERVYRDVNGMVDALGLNARALQAFVAGHSATSNNLTVDHLENADEWKIGDIYGLEHLQVVIGDELAAGKLTDISSKVEDIVEQDEQLARMTVKAAEVRKQISLRTDPEKRAQQQAAALPSETAAQQAELRHNVQHVQKLLAQIEESMSLLRADLATVAAASADTNGTTTMPTVEAVTKTILKMTSMIEKKSGDIDLLEAQIRKLPDGMRTLGMSASYEEGLIDSLAGSRLSNDFSLPPSRGRHAGGRGDFSGMSSMFGSRLGASVSSYRQSTTFDPTSSVTSRRAELVIGASRKKSSEVTTEDVVAWQSRNTQRRNVFNSLKRVVEKAGEPKIISPGNASM